MAVAERQARARAATLAMLGTRTGTLCPSEVARALATDWRAEMTAVHDAVDALVAEGAVRLSWKGVDLPRRAGPYRIRRAVEG